MPRGMVVFQDNADGETVTPMGRTARMGLRTRPVLGNLTNTPGALRKTTLKKNLTTQMSEGVQVRLVAVLCDIIVSLYLE